MRRLIWFLVAAMALLITTLMVSTSTYVPAIPGVEELQRYLHGCGVRPQKGC
jgi:hypothetical protein